MAKPKDTANSRKKRLQQPYIGEKFGGWTVEAKASQSASWLCRCTCGTVRVVRLRYLRNGASTSCGCQRSEKLRARHSAYNGARGRNSPEERHQAHLDYCRAYYQAHKEAIHTRKLAYWAEHHDELLQRLREYRRTHHDLLHTNNASYRARRKEAPINDLTNAQWDEIKAAYGNRCVYCGRKMKHLTRDHLTPLSKGGSHTAANIVPACQSCNSKKYNGPPLTPVQPLLLTISVAKPLRKRCKKGVNI